MWAPARHRIQSWLSQSFEAMQWAGKFLSKRARNLVGAAARFHLVCFDGEVTAGLPAGSQSSTLNLGRIG